MPGQIWQRKSIRERYPDMFSTNPFPEGTKGFEKWNELNPQAAEEARLAQELQPLTPYSPSFYSPEYGGIPATASPTRSAASAVTGNVANLPAIQGMAGDINRFNIGEMLGQYETALPGYGGMVSQSAQNIGSRLRGEIPADVVRSMTQSAAERGVAMGVPGSPFTNAELVRDLGLTSLDLQRGAEGELTQAIGRTPTVPLFNPSSFLVSPQEQQQAQQQANIMASAPVPAKAQQTALDIARAGIQAGASAIPQPQFAPSPQTNSYSLVSDILSRYAPQSQPTDQTPISQAVPAQPISTAPAPVYNVDVLPPAATFNFGYDLPANYGTTIPDVVTPPEAATLGFNYDDFGLWPSY